MFHIFINSSRQMTIRSQVNCNVRRKTNSAIMT